MKRQRESSEDEKRKKKVEKYEMPSIKSWFKFCREGMVNDAKWMLEHGRHTSAPGIGKNSRIPGLTTPKNAVFSRSFSLSLPGFPESRRKLRFFPGGRTFVMLITFILNVLEGILGIHNS